MKIGPGCCLYERADCRQRAFPPLHHRLVDHETGKAVSTYAFDTGKLSVPMPSRSRTKTAFSKNWKI